MAISLYDATVANYIQTVTAMTGVLDRGLTHCTDNGTDPNALVDVRLFPDMAPLRFQVVSIVHHSIEAIEGVEAGEFGPPTDQRPHDYAGLQGILADALAALKAISRERVEVLQGRPCAFKLGATQIPFTGENFLLSFSLPNFYFHCATAYDILRSQGVPLGKRDFMGPMRVGG